MDEWLHKCDSPSHSYTWGRQDENGCELQRMALPLSTVCRLDKWTRFTPYSLTCVLLQIDLVKMMSKELFCLFKPSVSQRAYIPVSNIKDNTGRVEGSASLSCDNTAAHRENAVFYILHHGLGFACWVVWAEVLVLLHLLLHGE